MEGHIAAMHIGKEERTEWKKGKKEEKDKKDKEDESKSAEDKDKDLNYRSLSNLFPWIDPMYSRNV